MAAALHLVTRTDQGVNDDRNLVREVIFNKDDGDTAAVIIQAAVDAMNLATPVDADAAKAYPDGYFDTVNKIGLTPSGVLATDLDILAFAPRVVATLT